MIKSVLKTGVSMVAGGVLVLAFTYNSKMPEIKAGIDNLKQITIQAKEDAKMSNEAYKELMDAYEKLSSSNKDLYDRYMNMRSEIDKANKEIEKANKEQVDILDYVDKTIQEVK